MMDESLEERIRRHERLTEIVRSIRGLVTGTRVLETLPTTLAPVTDQDDISEIVSLHRVETSDFL